MAIALFVRLRRWYGVFGILLWLSGCSSEEEQAPPAPVVIREGPPPIAKPLYTDLGTFIVNMPGDKYYLKGSIQLVLETPAAKSWLDVRLPLVKDLVIRQLQSVTVEQFDDLKNRPLLRASLQSRINSLFPNNPTWEDESPVRKILFLELYRQ
ncbi:MAG: flagellar basal body-associated FliL family protein [bacterium]|jgi:flagellar basal body-associated protein FliL